MTRIKKYIASRMMGGALQKHFKRDSIVQIFAGMDFVTQIHPRAVEGIQDGTPARCQFIKGRFNQPGRSLRPRIQVRPSKCPGKCNMGAESQIRGRFRREQ